MTTPTIANDNGQSRSRSGWRRWTWLLVAAPLLLGGVTYRAAEARGAGDGQAMHERMQARMQRILTTVGATDAQKAQIQQIWAGLTPQLKAAHQDHAKVRAQIEQAMTAATIDPAAIEKLRQQSVQSMDRASTLITQGMVATAQALTPDQRQKVLTEMHKHQGRHWGGGAGEGVGGDGND
jgi:Spy/CpxP family protein refolding chaperone